MARIALMAALLTAGLLALAGGASAHSDPCHMRYACPSDHHSYIWMDSSGKAWDCARPDAREASSADTTKFTVDGLPYLCHAAGASPTEAAPVAGGSVKAAAGSEEADAGGDTCGVERWAVKVASDPAASKIRLTAKPTTVRSLRKLPVPADRSSRTPPVETTIYTVRAKLVSMKVEEDSDMHLVIADPTTGGTMIVEFPSDGCTTSTITKLRSKIRAARQALLAACGAASTGSFRQLNGTATISGIGFFDFKHGQTGVAPNAIELHPVTAFSGKCA